MSAPDDESPVVDYLRTNIRNRRGYVGRPLGPSDEDTEIYIAWLVDKLKVDDDTFDRWRNGQVTPPQTRARKIAAVFLQEGEDLDRAERQVKTLIKDQQALLRGAKDAAQPSTRQQATWRRSTAMSKQFERVVDLLVNDKARELRLRLACQLSWVDEPSAKQPAGDARANAARLVDDLHALSSRADGSLAPLKALQRAVVEMTESDSQWPSDNVIHIESAAIQLFLLFLVDHAALVCTGGEQADGPAGHLHVNTKTAEDAAIVADGGVWGGRLKLRYEGGDNPNAPVKLDIQNYLRIGGTRPGFEVDSAKAAIELSVRGFIGSDGATSGKVVLARPTMDDDELRHYISALEQLDDLPIRVLADATGQQGTKALEVGMELFRLLGTKVVSFGDVPEAAARASTLAQPTQQGLKALCIVFMKALNQFTRRHMPGAGR